MVVINLKSKKRKPRKDKIYKYRKKKGILQPYFSKRKRDDPLKIWWWEIKPMSKESIKRIPKNLRPTAKKQIYVPGIRVDVLPERLSSPKEIEELALETIGHTGDFLLMMFCKRKNSWGVSPVKCARVIIKETSDGLKGQFVESFRLQRYWFWDKRK